MRGERTSLGPRHTIRTVSGRTVPLGAPTPGDIEIGDIAHGLSHICRFAGQTKVFYSVAQHSVHVSRIVPIEYARWGLLHDAAEAYLGDVPAPVKAVAGMEGYMDLEEELMAAVAARFGLPPPPMPECVFEADRQALADEFGSLCRLHHADVERLTGLSPNTRIEAVSSVEAKRMFLDRFEELGGGAAWPFCWQQGGKP